MLSREMVAEAMKLAIGNERLSPEQLAELQETKLRGLLRHAKEKSAFYADLYQSIDVERAPLTDLPTVTKKTIQANFDDVVTDSRVKLADVCAFCDESSADQGPWHLGEFAVMLSSGTTGERGYFVMDGPALADAIAAGYRQSNRGADPAQPPAQQRIAAVMLFEPFDAAAILMRMIPESVGPKKMIDIRDDVSSVCRELDEFQPTLLSSFPYMLRMLAAAKQDGKLKCQPARITCSGDVLTEGDRKFIQRAFGEIVFDYYCSTEVPYLAWESDNHDGLYVNADYVILESVDGQNLPVEPGRLGEKILVTNLSNRLMPMIRYEMSDQVEYTPEPGALIGPLPRIRTVAGRVEHTIVLPGSDAEPVSLIPEHIDDFVGSLENLTNYQIIQEEQLRLTVNYIPQPDADAEGVRRSVHEGLLSCFERYGVTSDLVIDMRQVERLEPVRPGSNKVCQYWNRTR